MSGSIDAAKIYLGLRLGRKSVPIQKGIGSLHDQFVCSHNETEISPVRQRAIERNHRSHLFRFN